MDPSTYKRHHVHVYDSRQLLDHYFSDRSDMVLGEDALIFPIKSLTQAYSAGQIKGDILLELSHGSLVQHLYSDELFNDIIVLKVKDRCILELKRWTNKRTGAFHWGHVTKRHVDLEGKSHQLEDKEVKVRSSNMTEPELLPPADCIISFSLLDVTSKDQDDYIRYLRKISGLLKPGGHFLLIGSIGVTYITVVKDKLRAFSYDEDFAGKALVGERFIVDGCKFC